jgi:hypothetical protein
MLRRHAQIAFAILLLAAGAVRAHDGGPTGPVVGDLSFADPAPAGIGYEWTVRLRHGERAELVNAVGAKSWNEPSNPEGLKGWTHTSNWIALELVDDAVVRITVVRQPGVVVPSGSTFAAARTEIVPALSLYRGWDETTVFEDHTFNNLGNFWSTIEYVGAAANAKSRPKVTYRVRLPAGRYSLVVGGNPRALGDASAYPANGCDPVDPTCYAYTGLHGYRAVLQAR